jgi:hypothetical protein
MKPWHSKGSSTRRVVAVVVRIWRQFESSSVRYKTCHVLPVVYDCVYTAPWKQACTRKNQYQNGEDLRPAPFISTRLIGKYGKDVAQVGFVPMATHAHTQVRQHDRASSTAAANSSATNMNRPTTGLRELGVPNRRHGLANKSAKEGRERRRCQRKGVMTQQLRDRLRQFTGAMAVLWPNAPYTRASSRCPKAKKA